MLQASQRKDHNGKPQCLPSLAQITVRSSPHHFEGSKVGKRQNLPFRTQGIYFRTRPRQGHKDQSDQSPWSFWARLSGSWALWPLGLLAWSFPFLLETPRLPCLFRHLLPKIFPEGPKHPNAKGTAKRDSRGCILVSASRGHCWGWFKGKPKGHLRLLFNSWRPIL